MKKFKNISVLSVLIVLVTFSLSAQQEEVSSCFAAFNYSVSKDTLRLNNTSYGVYDKVIWKIGQRFRHKNQVMEIMSAVNLAGYTKVALITQNLK